VFLEVLNVQVNLLYLDLSSLVLSEDVLTAMLKEAFQVVEESFSSFDQSMRAKLLSFVNVNRTKLIEWCFRHRFVLLWKGFYRKRHTKRPRPVVLYGLSSRGS
jgi:hypothetical protein